MPRMPSTRAALCVAPARPRSAPILEGVERASIEAGVASQRPPTQLHQYCHQTSGWGGASAPVCHTPVQPSPPRTPPCRLCNSCHCKLYRRKRKEQQAAAAAERAAHSDGSASSAAALPPRELGGTADCGGSMDPPGLGAGHGEASWAPVSTPDQFQVGGAGPAAERAATRVGYRSPDAGRRTGATASQQPANCLPRSPSSRPHRLPFMPVELASPPLSHLPTPPAPTPTYPPPGPAGTHERPAGQLAAALHPARDARAAGLGAAVACRQGAIPPAAARAAAAAAPLGAAVAGAAGGGRRRAHHPAVRPPRAGRHRRLRPTVRAPARARAGAAGRAPVRGCSRLRLGAGSALPGAGSSRWACRDPHPPASLCMCDPCQPLGARRPVEP